MIHVCRSDGTQVGEFSESEFREKIFSNEIEPEDRYWQEGMEDWKVVSEYRAATENKDFNAQRPTSNAQHPIKKRPVGATASIFSLARLSSVLGSPIALIIASAILILIIVSALLHSGESYSGAPSKMSIAERERVEKQAQDEEDILIEKHLVRIGMSANVCARSWGRPDHINTTITRFGRSEQWVYEDGRYLYMNNGVLTSIQK